MKKFLILCILSLVVFAGFNIPKLTATADAKLINFSDSAYTTQSSGEYDSSYSIVVTADNSVDAVITVASGHTLILDGVNLIRETNSASTLFRVSTGATLILRNMNLSLFKGLVGVENNGTVELDSVIFSALTTTAIVNNGSATSDSLTLHSVTIPSITLNSGYITVKEDTCDRFKPCKVCD